MFYFALIIIHVESRLSRVSKIPGNAPQQMVVVVVPGRDLLRRHSCQYVRYYIILPKHQLVTDDQLNYLTFYRLHPLRKSTVVKVFQIDLANLLILRLYRIYCLESSHFQRVLVDFQIYCTMFPNM